MEELKHHGVALAVWEDRLAPLVDTAKRFLVVKEPGNTDWTHGRYVEFDAVQWDEWDAFLRHERIGILIGGAISRALEWRIQSLGVAVHGFRRGLISDVWEAWKTERLTDESFFMPGCSRRRKGHQNGLRGGHRRGGRGVDGMCGCPVCGLKWSHKPGVPCQTRVCPHCGKPLRRVYAD